MFPTRNVSRTYVSQDIQDQDLMDINLLTSKQQFLNDSINNEGGDESSVISSLSDVSSVSKRSKWVGSKHGRTNCLHCCRVRKSQRSQNQSRLDGGTGEMSTTTLCEMYTNASAALVAAGIQATVALSRKGGGSNTTGAGIVGVISNKSTTQQNNQQPQQYYSNTSSLQLSELQFHSPESILSEESLPDKLTANILYNVQRLANPVSAKQSKMALLELKQKHPSSFQDICLYSEVCRTLGRSSYRMNARRFLQELFLDLDFDSFYNEPMDIINKKERESFKNCESKDRNVGSDKLSLLKERMKRDLNSSGGRLDNTSIDARVESVQSAATGSNNVIAIGSQALKAHIKSQPLASVYEASCENLLLDPSPRLKNSTITGKDMSSKQNCKNFIIAPPPAAPPPLQEYNTELRITSDDDEDENDNVNEDDTSTNRYHVRSIQRQKQNIRDEVDSITVRSSVNSPTPASSNLMLPIHSTTAHSSQSNYNFLQSVGTVSTPISSSNCSDQTTTSNRSSICTISHQPLNTNNSNKHNSTPVTSPLLPKSIENENTKFRRGRFYTLELDLSCSKNKFPITDRTKTNLNSTIAPKAAIDNSQTTLLPASSSSLSTITSPSRTITTNATLLRQHSLDSEASSNFKLPITRLSYTAGLLPSTTLSNTISSTNDSNNPKYLITKSLASSLAQPFGTLFCEKRLQSSKSEALLMHNPPVTSITLSSSSKTYIVDSSVGSSDNSFQSVNIPGANATSRPSSGHEGQN